MFPFSEMIGRGTDIDNDLSLSHQGLGDRRPLRIPDIFADIHPDANAFQHKNRGLLAALKVPLLVEYPIVGQMNFMVDSGKGPFVQNRRSVIDIILTIYIPDDDGNAPRMLLKVL